VRGDDVVTPTGSLVVDMTKHALTAQRANQTLAHFTSLGRDCRVRGRLLAQRDRRRLLDHLVGEDHGTVKSAVSVIGLSGTVNAAEVAEAEGSLRRPQAVKGGSTQTFMAKTFTEHADLVPARGTEPSTMPFVKLRGRRERRCALGRE
jgi:hypothetical protein